MSILSPPRGRGGWRQRYQSKCHHYQLLHTFIKALNNLDVIALSVNISFLTKGKKQVNLRVGALIKSNHIIFRSSELIA